MKTKLPETLPESNLVSIDNLVSGVVYQADGRFFIPDGDDGGLIIDRVTAETFCHSDLRHHLYDNGMHWLEPTPFKLELTLS